jgi:acyl dehydratase
MMAAKVVQGIDGIKALAGEKIGSSEWFEITQDRVNQFADATLDHQWIHTDPARAKETPFGGTIVHGYLTLSLLPHLLHEVVDVQGVKMAINYGLNKLRFPSPVRVGKKVRLNVEAQAVEDVPGGVQCQLGCAVEVEGGDKPAMVAEVLFRYYG